MTLFKMWQKQMKQKAKNGRKKTRFWKYKRKRKKQETRLPIFKMQQMQMKKEAKKKRKKSFLKIQKNQETRLPLFKMQPTSAAAPTAARYKGTAISTKTPKRNIVFS